VFFFQAADGGLLASLTLAASDRRRWLATLSGKEVKSLARC
jgi:hypothetical protein